MRSIAVFHAKGGVGKTTTAIGLADAAVRRGWHTVVWDLDPQGAASWLLRVEPTSDTDLDELLGPDEVLSAVRATDRAGLDLLPSDISLRHLDRHLAEVHSPKRVVLGVLRTLAQRYEIAILDCPPGLSFASELQATSVDALVVPVVPNPFALRALGQIEELFAKRLRKRDVPVLPFASMVDRRRRAHRHAVDELRATHPDALRTEVPYLAEIERMAEERAPVSEFARSGRGAEAHRALWEEIEARTA